MMIQQNIIFIGKYVNITEYLHVKNGINIKYNK